jgi:hypothetical protein
MYKSIDKAHKVLNIESTMKTQMGRKGGASTAENLGASQESLIKLDTGLPKVETVPILTM